MKQHFFTEEHDMFRKSVRDFVTKNLLPHANEWEEAEDYPKELFKTLADMNFLGIRYPEKYGGMGLDIFYDIVFYEELYRSRMPGLCLDVMVDTDMATPVLFKHGTEEQKTKYLTKMIKGEAVFAIGYTEPNAGSDVARIRSTAKKTDGGYLLNGSKIFITNGTWADYIIVAAKTDSTKDHKGITLFLLDTKTKGFTVGRKLKKLGHHTSHTAELFFDDCFVPENMVVGEVNKGFYYIMEGFQTERIMGSVGVIALAQVALEDAVSYSKERMTFGKPISQHQAIAHKMVDMATQLEAARQLAYNGAWLLDQGEDATKEISMAKLYSCEVANKVTYDAIQVFGGYGYMEEYPVARAYRDARMFTIGAGTTEIMKEIIAKRMGLY
jgi:alkylation response protein AidB-like acyl-CoA dehydrogenase